MNRCAATKRRSTVHHSLSPSWLVAGSSAAPPFQLMRICNQRSHWLEACYCGRKLVIHSSYADSFFWAGSLIFSFWLEAWLYCIASEKACDLPQHILWQRRQQPHLLQPIVASIAVVGPPRWRRQAQVAAPAAQAWVYFKWIGKKRRPLRRTLRR